MKIVAVLRKPEGLTALISRRRPNADLDSLLASEEDAASWLGLHEIVEFPLADVPVALCPEKGPLLAAWAELGHVRVGQQGAYAAIQKVLRGTVVGLVDPLDPPPLRVDSPPPIFPTAAHPRAYRGTKYQPPKPKSAAPEDLRPHLCSPMNLAALLHRLSEDVPEMRAVAGEAAWEFRLPPAFRTHFLPRVRSQGRAAANTLLSLYWRLNCESHTAILDAAACLVSLGSHVAALPWLELTAELPAERRALLLDLLLETQAYECDLAALPPSDRQFLIDTALGDRAISHLYSLFRAWRHGISFDYLAAGFRFDAQGDLPFPFHSIDWAEIVPGAYYPETAIAKAAAHWAACRDYHASIPWIIWRECGRLAGVGPFIESIDWQQYQPDTSYQYARFYRLLADYDGTPEEGAQGWAIIERHAPVFEALLRDTPPEYHAKLLANLMDFWWQWEDAKTFPRCLPALDVLLRRLCRPPFRLSCNLDSACADFLEFLNLGQTEQFLSAPDACFHRLEDACRRDNDARLCGFGTWTLARLRPQWLLDAFFLHPVKLFGVCKRLGSFSHGLCDSLVRETALETADVSKPRLLREHEEGLRRLPDSQRAHYQAEWRRRVMLHQLQDLEAAALARMAEGLTPNSAEESVRHALQIQWDADDNRRALRRFLKAYWNGQTDYREIHPRTQDWRRRHPTVDLTLWQQGISYAVTSPRFGLLTITVEQDPLEALKLGTYVGSCLGLGGRFSYSAAAVVLDINKQVLYARRPDGSVLARQLVAVSNDNHLVAFPVYPVGTVAEVQRYFSEYNRRFADALGMPLRQDDCGPDAEIETILAHSWWHDMEWAGKKLPPTSNQRRRPPCPEGRG